MLNCIIATMRPKSGTKCPSTPVSFMRRSTVSAWLREVRISKNSRLASGFLRSSASISLSEREAACSASGWNASAWRSARWKMRIRLTESRRKTSGSLMLMRLLSTMKSALSLKLRRPRGLGLARLQARAQDRREIADVLGDQKIMLHEPLDVLQARMLGVAQPHRDLALDVEGQPLLGAAGEEMHVAAHRPQEIPAAAENSVFLLVEHAVLKQLLGFAHAIDVFGDPEQRVQIAQAALAVLDVGLDEVARLPGAAVALLALGELGGDELRGAVLHDVTIEARDELVVEPAIADQITGLQHRGADRHVGLGLADAFVDRAGGVADLQAHVPQAIENRLGDRFAPGGLLVRQQEQEIDVGARRQ